MVKNDINIIGGYCNDSVLNMCIDATQGYKSGTYKECSNYKCFMELLKQKSIDPMVANKRGYNAFDLCYRSGKVHYLSHLKVLNK